MPSTSSTRSGSSGARLTGLLPWPAAAARFRTEWLPHADWVELEGVGHAPQLDVPLETAQLILGFTA
jgi:pimeloyl-ACP methyl ester carboxylesterase